MSRFLPLSADRSHRRAIRMGAAAVVLLVPLGLAACEDNQFQETTARVNGSEGANSSGTAVQVRNARIATPEDGSYGAGDDAEILFTLVNTSDERDRLVGIASSDAAAVEVRSAAGGPSSVDLEIPAASKVGVTAYLVDLGDDVLVGSSVPVTFTFDTNPPIDLNVPVATPDGREDREPEEIHTAE